MGKSKIAITIEDDLLKRIDKSVDGDTIRNRSHAIEYFLHQALSPKAEKAVLIAGHKDFSCATLFEGKPLIEHHLQLLLEHGVKEVLLLLHKGEQEVQGGLGDGTRYGIRIRYQWLAPGIFGTAHILSLTKKFTGDDLFFALYVHTVAELDLKDFAAYHREANVVGTVALTSIEDPSLYGAVHMKGDKIVAFSEKPKEREGVSRVISTGLFCFDPEIFEYIPRQKTASLEKDVFPRLAKEGKLAGYMFEGKWCNVRNLICFPAKKK